MNIRLLQGARLTGHRQRGVVLVLFAFVLMAMGAMMSLALNAAHGVAVKTELQNAVDAAALAGAKDLDGTLTGATSARNNALAWAQSQYSDNESLKLDKVISSEDVVLGHWDLTKKTFAPTGTSDSDLRITNAVCVQASRGAKTNKCVGGGSTSTTAVPAFFGAAFLKKATMDVAVHSIGLGGGACAEKCILPIAFPSCSILNADNTLQCGGLHLETFTNDNSDTIGWTVPDGSASTSSIVQTLNSLANGNCSAVSQGSILQVTNGNNINAPQVTQAIKPYCNKTYSAPIMEPGGNSCMKFSGSWLVAGFATVLIGDVMQYSSKTGWSSLCGYKNGPKKTCLKQAQLLNKPPAYALCIEVQCVSDSSSGSPGCEYFGRHATQEILAQ